MFGKGTCFKEDSVQGVGEAGNGVSVPCVMPVSLRATLHPWLDLKFLLFCKQGEASRGTVVLRGKVLCSL